jgi:hypothetical protein
MSVKLMEAYQKNLETAPLAKLGITVGRPSGNFSGQRLQYSGILYEHPERVL